MNSVESPYVEVTRRINGIAGLGAALITVLTIATAQVSAHVLAEIIAGQLAVIAFNVLINKVLLARWGIFRAELLRSSVNLVACLVTNHLAMWPLAAWLFLPFVALVFDNAMPRVARATIAAFCVAFDAVAVYDHVDWKAPVVFTVGAVFCALVSDARFRVIRSMLEAARADRVAIATAHERTQAALRHLHEEVLARERVELELREAQKLEAVGRLASGVAHEINTPLQYVITLRAFLQESLEQLLASFSKLRAVASLSGAQGMLEREVLRIASVLDLDDLHENVPNAIRLTNEGIARVAEIVASMKELSAPASGEKVALDVNRTVRNALTIAYHQYHYVADVREELGDVPLVHCRAAEIQQAVVNLVVNAAYGVADGGITGSGLITIRTARDGDDVVLTVADNGNGIPVEIRPKIFEPFVAGIAGHGLAIARSIVDRHGGKLTFTSRPGDTTFTMRLPIGNARTVSPYEGLAQPSSRVSTPAR